MDLQIKTRNKITTDYNKDHFISFSAFMISNTNWEVITRISIKWQMTELFALLLMSNLLDVVINVKRNPVHTKAKLA